MRRQANALACLLVIISGASAGDLKTIDRSIRKEPVYKGQPRYCLFVFGPEAKFKVWTVLDGNVLYVDRNGDGDLTEIEERILPEKSGEPSDSYFSFVVPTLTDGALTHKNLRMRVNKGALASTIDMYVEVQWPGFKGGATDGRVEQTAGADSSGTLEFGDSPEQSAIVHFGGRLQMMPISKQTLRINREHDLQLGVGTPGIGDGSFGWIGEGTVIPETAFPKVAITFPAGDGQPAVSEAFELKHRC